MTELHVVALSGGKDSTAMALRLRELNPGTPYTYVCTPTGDELPEMFAHWRSLSVTLGGRIIPIMYPGGLRALVERNKAIPSWRMRFCTRDLKILPYAAWLSRQVERFDRVVSYVGLRTDEPLREGGDYSAVPKVESVFPLRDWGWCLNDVLNYLLDCGIVIPARTDCARCFFQRLSEWYALWRDHRDIFDDAAMQEAAIGHTWRSPGRDTWPAALDELAFEFQLGYVPKERKTKDAIAAMQCRVCRI
jgi:hypothetical protein